MARLFDDAASQYLELASALLTAVPITFACWAYLDAAVDQTLMSISNNGNDDNFFALRARGDVAGEVEAHTRDAGGSVQATSTAGFSVNTLFHAAAVFASAISRTAYFNGGNAATETTSRTPVGVNRTAIGRLVRATSDGYVSGRLAEVGIWNVALTADEVASLAKGVSPLMVRPPSLVLYLPIYGNESPEVDRHKGVSFALGGSPVKAEHPRVFMPEGRPQ